MPRRRLPPRLYYREDERAYVIRDGAKQLRTGSGLEDREGAEKALAEYIEGKFEPAKRESRLSRLTVAEVLTAYGTEHAPSLEAADRAGDAILALTPWWGMKTLMDVRGSTCRAYAAHRRAMPTHQGDHVADGTIRRELAVLSAAIRHWHKEHGPLESVPIVTRPEPAPATPDFLTRSEAAVILAGFLGWYRTLDGAWKRDRAMALPHLVRFFLIGIYSGTRKGAILSLQWMPNTTGGWIDFEAGILNRRGRGMKQTNKRQPQAKLGRRILAHLRRWKRMDDELRDAAAVAAGEPVASHLYVINWGGRRITSITTGWQAVLERVGQKRRYTPHVTRHTRATWLMQDGVEMWEAAGNLGMSINTLEKVYAHHHPSWQKRAAEV